MSAIKIIQGLARKSLIKDQGSGIRSIPSVMEAEAKAGEIAAILQSGGMPLQQLDDYIRSEKDLLKYLNIIKNANKPRVIAGDSPEGKGIMEALLGKRGEVVDMAGKKLDTSQGIMGGKSVKELMDSGQVTKGARGMKKSKKVQDREMFQDANKRLKTDVNKIIADIKAMDPMDSMKEANSVIGRKGVYKNLTPEESKKILKDTEDHIFERDIPIDPEDMATGGRAGFAGGLLAQLGKGFMSPSTSGAIKLVKGFMKATGRKPNKDEILKIIKEAAERDLDNAISSAKPPGLMSKDEFAMNVGGGSKAIGRRIKEIDQDALRKSIDEFNIPIRTQEPFDFADGGVAGLLGERPGYSIGQSVQPNNFMNLGLGNITQGQNTQTAGLFGFGKSDEEKALEQIQDLRNKENQIKALGEGAIELKQDELKDIEQQIQDLKNQYSDDEDIQQAYDPYAGIKGQTAGLGVASFLVDKFGPKIGAAIFNYGKKKFLNKSKNVFIDKPIQKILTTSGGIKKIKTGGGETGGGGDRDIGGNRNVGGGNTAKNSLGQTAAQATAAGTGTSQGYSQHFADGGPARQNFAMGKRAFLKLMGGVGAGIAGLKSGLFGIGGKEATKKAVTETVKSAGSGYPPPYFFKLVEKIKFMGDDVTQKAATQEREIVKRYKDYEMTEDLGTGNIVIKKRNEGVFYDQDGIISDEYIVYKPGQADELTKGKKPPPEYDEYTVRPDSDGKLRDSEDGLDSIDEILEEVGDPDSMTLKKASGGIARMLGE